MLPAATSERMQRESVKGRPGGRTYEIQRLIGRALRGVVDTSVMGERTVTIDCDVLQADGGTRCASITGGYIALVLALRKVGPRARHHQQDRRHQRGHRGRHAAARPRVPRGLERRGRLQRRGHGRRHVRRDPGHRGGQALRPRPDGPPPGARRRRPRRSSSPCRPRCSRSGDGSVGGRPERFRSGASCWPRGRATRCAELAELLDLPGVTLRHARTRSASKVSRSRTPTRSAATPRSRSATTPRAPGCPPWPMIRASRWTRSMDGPASTRGATRDPMPPTRRTTRGSWPSSTACRPSGAAARYHCVLAYLDPGAPGVPRRSSATARSRAASRPVRVATAASATTPSSSPHPSRPEGVPWAR